MNFRDQSSLPSGAVLPTGSHPNINNSPLLLLLFLLSAIILLALPSRILQLGFFPPDDALCYAARAVSGKSWPEILVIRQDVLIDHNPGWNWLQASVHRLTGWNTHALVVFSVVSTFFLFAASPLPWFRRPEAWLAALAITLLLSSSFAARAFAGRPLSVTIAVTSAILCWCRGRDHPLQFSFVLVFPILLFALTTWVHEVWYLMPLVPFSFLAARRWRDGAILAFCWAVGTLLGASLSGHPFSWLKESFLTPFLVVAGKTPPHGLVGELQPSGGSFGTPLVIVAVLVWRKMTGRDLSQVLRDPAFIIALLGWLLGFKVLRFELDWGLPALALWLGFQLEEFLESKQPRQSWLRLGVIAAAAACLFLLVASDHNKRWSQYGQFEALDSRRPEHAPWLPGPGGILYSVNLSVFYETFYTNPHGQWRYALGFEPSFMTPENYAVYIDLWQSLNAIRACAPWVRKMTPADRLVLVSGPQPQPAIPGLEWFYAAKNTWVGRPPASTGP